MKISQDTSSYNDRRYGKPWIALVDFSTGAKSDFSFGEWCGQSSGDEGTLYVEAEVGDVIATGQKDHRNPRKSAPEFFVVRDGGQLESVTKSEAYKHWQSRGENETESNPLAEVSTDDLIAELQSRGVTV